LALDNFSDLKASIVAHLDRDDLTPFVDDFIRLAEARHERDIRIREMAVRGSLTVNSRYVNFPDGMLEIQSIRILTSPTTPLTYVSIPEMARRRRDENGKPQYFTIGAQIEFDCQPDDTYTADIFYFRKEPGLSDSAPVNRLLQRAPDAYLYGALLASAPFLRNDDRIEMWAALYKSCVDGLAQSRNQDRVSGPLVSRVYGATP